ncbi:MAG: M67 family metallopeptidase [Thaumarchaeota archaeon]|nr:M67 family metallopeptidase [Nitrososphaerota archaeon]
MNAESAHSGTEFNPARTKVVLHPQTTSLMESHAASSYPEECCGLLLGSYEDNSRIKRVNEAKRMSNIFQKEERYHRYTIDPKEYLKVENEAESMGFEVVGIYHSHPEAPAKPSQFDMVYAWPTLSYVVISVKNKVPAEAKSWILKNDRSEFIQEELMVTEETKIG